MTPRVTQEETESGVKIYFNPFAFTIEQNNAFLAAGYEVIPIRVPRDDPA